MLQLEIVLEPDAVVDRPLMRYHGDKFRLADWIISHFPKHHIYVEPFGGGGSVLLQKPRCYAEIYNDLDEELCNLFRVVRNPKQGERLARLCEFTPFSRDEFQISYLPSGDPVEQARRTVFRSAAGFSSTAQSCQTGFRCDSKRPSTIPAHDWAGFPETLRLIIKRLRGVVIENCDASAVMIQHDTPNTLHYCDPPYLFSTRNNGKGNYRHEMTDEQHVKFADTVKGLKGMVIVSGYRSGLYDELFNDWECSYKMAVAQSNGGGHNKVECLWMNPACSAASPIKQLKLAI